jgi:hypothetical protein
VPILILVDNNRVLFYPGNSTIPTVVYGQGGNFNTSTSGSGLTGFGQPWGVEVDSFNNVYISDDVGSRILKYPPGSTTPTRVWGTNQCSFTVTNGCNQGGTVGPSSLCGQGALRVTPTGQLLVADTGNQRILSLPMV